jgi:enamine deaminase RidA (YjgF/YER057c/UK114 family)
MSENGPFGDLPMPHSFNVPTMRKPFGIFAHAAWQPEGHVLHVSGMAASTPEVRCVGIGDIREQTRQTLRNLQTVLEHAGGEMSDIVSVIVYTTSMTYLDAIHEVRAEFFKPPYPASTLVQVVALVVPDMLVEISAVAVIPASRSRR